MSVTFSDTGAPQADLSWEVTDGFSLVVIGPYEAFKTGDFDIDLAEPIPKAAFYVDGHLVESGVISLEVGADGINGDGEVSLGEVHFSGRLIVSCMVPPDRISEGAQAARGVSAVEDSNFTTPECQTVKADGF